MGQSPLVLFSYFLEQIMHSVCCYTPKDIGSYFNTARAGLCCHLNVAARADGVLFIDVFRGLVV
jgi:hypothetical protein